MLYHNYIFLRSRPELRNVSKTVLARHKHEFIKTLAGSGIIFNTYSVLGLEANMNILLWLQSDSIEKIQNTLNDCMHTGLGKYLDISHVLFGMTRPTQYSARSNTHIDTDRKGKKYLIIYPFNKTKEWYFLSADERRKLMAGHISIGKKYPMIEQLLLYSYGVDDNEFIVSYETDDLGMFQSLVMELRSDNVRAFTLKDTPVFTCIYKSPTEVLEYL